MRPGRDIVERRIARISKTFLGWEDHGIFTCCLSLNFGNSSQGFGGYGLDDAFHENGKFVGRRPTAAGLAFIMATLKACGVDSWEKLPGRTVYALIDAKQEIRGLAPLPTEKGEEFHVDQIWEGDD